MMKDGSGWISVGILLAFMMVLYAINSYDDLFNRRIAYLYDPATDDVFAIQMAPTLSRYRKWEPFIPFRSLQYDEPDMAEYLGKLDSKIAIYRADMELLRTDIDAWAEKNDREHEELLSNLSSNDTEIDFWNVEYFPRPDKDMRSLIPTTLSDILSEQENQTELMVVDAVIGHTIIPTDGSWEEPTTIRIVREGLLIKGSAAYILSEQGLH